MIISTLLGAISMKKHNSNKNSSTRPKISVDELDHDFGISPVCLHSPIRTKNSTASKILILDAHQTEKTMRSNARRTTSTPEILPSEHHITHHVPKTSFSCSNMDLWEQQDDIPFEKVVGFPEKIDCLLFVEGLCEHLYHSIKDEAKKMGDKHLIESTKFLQKSEQYSKKNEVMLRSLLRNVSNKFPPTFKYRACYAQEMIDYSTMKTDSPEEMMVILMSMHFYIERNVQKLKDSVFSISHVKRMSC